MEGVQKRVEGGTDRVKFCPSPVQQEKAIGLGRRKSSILSPPGVTNHRSRLRDVLKKRRSCLSDKWTPSGWIVRRHQFTSRYRKNIQNQGKNQRAVSNINGLKDHYCLFIN